MSQNGTPRLSLAQMLSPEYITNPYLLYHQLRTKDPVLWDEGMSGWVLTGYAEVIAALRDPRFSAAGFMENTSWIPEEMLATLGPPVRALARQRYSKSAELQKLTQRKENIMAQHIVSFLIKKTGEVQESIIESSLSHVESQIMNQILLFENIYGPIELISILTEIQPPEVTIGITSKGEPAVNGMLATLAPTPDGRVILKTDDRMYITDVTTLWTTYHQDKVPDMLYVEKLEKMIAYYRKELEWLIDYVDNLPPEAIQIKPRYMIRDSIREMLDEVNR